MDTKKPPKKAPKKAPKKPNTRHKKKVAASTTKKITKRKERIIQRRQAYMERVRSDPEKLEAYRNRGAQSSKRYRENQQRDPAFLEKERQRKRALYWQKKKEELENASMPMLVHKVTVPFVTLESQAAIPLQVKVEPVKLPKLERVPTTIRAKLNRMRELETALKDSLWLESNMDPLRRVEQIKYEPADV